jgi:membrane protease YdiL (CAAX protease family)
MSGRPILGGRLAQPALLLLLALAVASLPMPVRAPLALLAFAPVIEEILFRHGLQAWLWRQGCSSVVANVVVALVFALGHMVLRSPALGLAVLAPALLIGWLYTRTRRLWPCIALHAGMNAVWLAGLDGAWATFSMGIHT